MKTFGILAMFACWFVAMASVAGLVFAEFVGVPGRPAPRYGDIVAAQEAPATLQGVVSAANHQWYFVTLLVGAMLLFAAVAYLMYVKFVVEPYGQEAVVLGASSLREGGTGGRS